MNKDKKELNKEALESAAGGNFLPNLHSDSEYASAGIRVVSHFFANDEFWWRGENIGWDKADAVCCFTKEIGRQPETVAEAVHYVTNKKTPTPHVK